MAYSRLKRYWALDISGNSQKVDVDGEHIYCAGHIDSLTADSSEIVGD